MKKTALPQLNEISPQEEFLSAVATDLTSMKEAVIVPELFQSTPLSRDQFMTDQKNDPELYRLADKAFTSKEASDVHTC